ncbi:MAG TPA: hypothetical protein VMT43_07595 [Acidimicrobiales bacterium]|nr:hypothetical protein [Acidimicrobiales bacterium]
MSEVDELGRRARRLAAALEPVIGQVYFSPECHRAYEALGFSPSPGESGGVAMPDGVAYFTSRGSALGQAPGELVASAFAVFNPAVVVPCVQRGWSLTDAPTIAGARLGGAVAQLARILGEQPEGVDQVRDLLLRACEPLRVEGRPLFAGVVAQGLPGDPLGDVFRAGDRLRECRGDSHTAAWVAAGFDATEIGLLTELYLGIPTRTYIRTRAWSDDQLDAAEARLTARGLLHDGAFTDAGRAAREEIERVTDAQMRPAVEALGDDAEELTGRLAEWSGAIRAAGGYPSTVAQLAP